MPERFIALLERLPEEKQLAIVDTLKKEGAGE